MNPVPEPKDGNKGKKKPTLPLKYIETQVAYLDFCVTYTVISEDALGERYSVTESKFYYEMELINETSVTSAEAGEDIVQS